MATLQLPTKIKNRVSVRIDIDGQVFNLSYDIPDAPGHVSVPDRNHKWLDEQIRQGLKGRLGLLIPVEA